MTTRQSRTGSPSHQRPTWRLVLLASALFAVQAVGAATAPWTLISSSASDPAPNWSPPDQASGDSPEPALADLNGDNKPDLLFGVDPGTGGSLVAYENTGSATAPAWSPAPSAWTTLSAPCNVGGDAVDYTPALADLNGDGLKDLVLGTREGVCVYQNTGTSTNPTWTRNTVWETGLSALATNRFYVPTLADVNNDGKVDLLVSYSHGDLLGLENTGTASAPSWTVQPAWNSSLLEEDASPELADLDGDGKYDLLIADRVGNIYAFKNVGTKSSPDWKFAPAWSPVLTTSTTLLRSMGVAVHDLNGDGRPDFMYTAASLSTPASTAVYEQSPAGLPDPDFASGNPAANGTTVTDTFDGFACPGAWEPATGGTNSSYTRDCGNGWTAYAEDTFGGKIGDQNVVAAVTAINGPSADAGTPLGVAEITTAPATATGQLWLMKTFPVTPGVPVQTIKADYRIGIDDSDSEYFGMVVFDGIVTNPSGKINKNTIIGTQVLRDDLPLDGPTKCSTSPCPWHTVDLGGVLPTHAYVTVAFLLNDVRTVNTPFMQIDNLVVGKVINETPVTLTRADMAQQWKVDYQAPGTNSGGQASNSAESKAVQTDAAGNEYVVGDVYNGADYDIQTFKYDPSGTLLWSKTYDGGSSDQAAGLALDASGDVYVAGRSFNSATGSNDYVAVKYGSSGTRQWASTFDNGSRDDQPAGLAVDAGGAVFVTGSSCSGDADCKFATVKFDSAGVEQWRQMFDNGGAATVSKAAAIGLDGTGAVYIAGSSRGSGADGIVTVKYDNGTGTRLRLNQYQTGSEEQASLMRTDSTGDVYIAGLVNSKSAGNLSLIVLKYAAGVADGGSPAWVKLYDANYETLARGMALDSSGNVYITGITGSPGDFDMLTLKLLANGDIAWSKTFGTANRDDRAAAIAVDAGDNVYVAGSYSTNVGNQDLLLLKYDSSGVARSAITYDGYMLNDTAVGLALAVDGSGDTAPIVIGTSADSNALDHLATVRYEKAYPDLTVSAVTGPSSATVGNTITVANTVLNVNDLAHKKHLDSGSFTVGLFLAADVGGTADLTDLTAIGTRSVSNLSPGQSSADNTSVVIPDSVAEGDYFLVVRADSTGAVLEEDETNNTVPAGSKISIKGNKPDLVVSDVTGPTSANRGDTVSVTTTVTNGVSTATGTAFRVGIYLSSDTTIGTDDILLGSYTVSGLAGYASETTSTDVTVPAGISGGNYYLGAVADDQGAVTEADEGNNAGIMTGGSSSSTLLATSADLLAGLPGTNVEVDTAGGSANVRLAQSAAWTATPAWDSPDTASAYAKPAMGDLNGDGLADIIVGDYQGSLFSYENVGTTSGPAWQTGPSSWTTLSTDCNAGGDNTYKVPALIDVDGDGLLDLVIGTRGGVCLYHNTGTTDSPIWTRATAWETGLTGLPTNNFYQPALADLDDDGKVDLMLGQTSGVILAYRNTGTATAPSWTQKSSWSITGLPNNRYAPALADLNGDGNIDLLLGDNVGNVIAYENTGTPAVPAWTVHSAWNIADPDASYSNEAGPAFGDLDGDGRIDLLYGDSRGVSFGYRNTGPYSTPGTYLSRIADAGSHGGFTTLSYIASVPSGTTLTVDIRAGDDIQGTVTAVPGTGADGAFDSATYDGTSIPGITGTSPSLTINTDNAPQTVASGDSVYPNGAGIFNFTDFTIAAGDTVTVSGGKALVIRTNTGNVVVAGTLNASATANGAAGPGGYNGGFATSSGSGPGGGTQSGGSLAGGGGGYGGAGGAGGDGQAGGSSYGSDDVGVFYGGSGGGGCQASTSVYGGGGGGAVKIESSADIEVSGSIRATGGAGATCTVSNGNTGAYVASGGGAGGAVYLSANHVTVSGTIDTGGGAGGNTPANSSGGGGGGGRIYVRGASSVNVTGTITRTGGSGGTTTNNAGVDGADGSYLVPKVTPIFDSTWTPWLTGVANAGDISALGTKRYVQYRINLATSNTSVSPAMYNIKASTQPPPPQPVVVALLSGSNGAGGTLGGPTLLLLALAVTLTRRRQRQRPPLGSGLFSKLNCPTITP